MLDGITLRAFGLGGGGNTDAETPVQMVAKNRKPRLGLALGGGAARGWAHLGVVRALLRAGLEPDVIAGTSIGAVVGGCYAAGKLDELEAFARSLNKRRVVSLMDFHIGGSGLIVGDRLCRLLEHDLGRTTIEGLPLRFAAIATELGSGHEIWLTRGRLVEALRASYSLPGIFNPVKLGGRWLMDGALVNPIPVTTARALGAEMVICVNLSGDVRSMRGTIIPAHGSDEDGDDEDGDMGTTQAETARGFFAPVWDATRRVGRFARSPNGAPGIGTVMLDAFNITQDRIARSRLAGDPPDIMISPRLGRHGLFDFHRADEAIQHGEEAAEKALPEIRGLLSEAAPHAG
jgi:NTE family protein